MFVPDKREKDKMERKKKNLDVYRNIAQVWSQKNDIDLLFMSQLMRLLYYSMLKKLRNFLFSLIRVVVNVIFPGLFQINWGNHTSLGTEDNESTDEKKKKNHRHNYFPQSFIHIVVNMKQLVPTSSHKLVSQKVWNKCGRFHAW